MGVVTTAVIVGGVVAATASTANAIDQNNKAKDARTRAGDLDSALKG